MRQINRWEPKLPTRSYNTYQILAPLSTHFRKATCEEVECEQYTHGWRIRVETLLPQQLHDAKNSGRQWKLVQIKEGETYLVFHAGQPCFKESTHRVPLEREPLFLVGRGDWRSYLPREAKQHKRSRDWVDDFATHQDQLATRMNRG